MQYFQNLCQIVCTIMYMIIRSHLTVHLRVDTDTLPVCVQTLLFFSLTFVGLYLIFQLFLSSEPIIRLPSRHIVTTKSGCFSHVFCFCYGVHANL